MKRIAIVTGASSGLGRQYAGFLDRHVQGLDEIWLIARRRERLMKIAAEFRTPVKVLALDLTSADDRNGIAQMLAEDACEIRFLIQAAGCGRSGAVRDIPPAVTQRMIELNCKALTALTEIALPYTRRDSVLIFLSSASAYAPQPRFAVYAATKAYVRSFALALAQEERKKGIRVLCVCPGPVDTEFISMANPNGKVNAWKKRSMARPYDVVKESFRDLVKGRKISVYSTGMKACVLVSKITPHSLLVPVMDRLLK